MKPQKNRSLLTIILERSECFNLSSELIFCPQNQYYFCNARRGCVIIPNKFQTSETCKRAQSWNPNYVNNNHLTPTSVKHEQPQKLRGFFSLLISVYALVYPPSTVWWTPFVIILKRFQWNWNWQKFTGLKIHILIKSARPLLQNYKTDDAKNNFFYPF